MECQKSNFFFFSDTSQGRALSEKVEEALAMLEAYNKRLAEEMEARKAVARMLHDYIAHQKDLLAQAEETLEVSSGYILVSLDLCLCVTVG